MSLCLNWPVRHELGRLHAELAALDGTRRAGEIVPLMQQALAGRRYQIGLQGIYTSP